jgi:iron complex outermembrane receptor protein
MRMVKQGLGTTVGLQVMAAAEPGLAGVPLSPRTDVSMALAKHADALFPGRIRPFWIGSLSSYDGHLPTYEHCPRCAMSTLARYSQHLATLLPTVGCADFPENLADAALRETLRIKPDDPLVLDLIGTALNLETYRIDQTGDYFQQELRLTSNSDGAFSWYTGASYYQEDIKGDYRFAGEEELFCQYYGYYGLAPSSCQDLFDYYEYEWYPSANGLLEETARVESDYEGWGAYLKLAYQITETIQVEGGVRYSDDEKQYSMNVPTPQSELGPYWAWQFSTDGELEDTKSWDKWTPRFIAKWTPTDTALVFASYTAGYKSGGFSTFSVSPTPEFAQQDLSQADGYRPDTVDPEEVDSYEIGYKDTLFGGIANFDITAFYYDYTDLQVTVGTEGGPTLTKNAGQVEARGAEGAVTAGLGDNFTAYVTLACLDSEATDIQDICGLEDPNGCENNRIYSAPEWSGSFVLNANFPIAGGALTGNYELVWESERGGGREDCSYTMIEANQQMAMRIAYESENNWFVQGYVENMTNEFTWDGQNNLGGKEPDVFFGPLRPRTYGMRLGYSWD